MRYSKSETTHILGIFNNGDTVTIDVYRLSDNTKVVDSATCSEIGSTGVFGYEFSQTVTQKEEFLWIMSNGEYSKYGKIVLGGYVDAVNDNINQHRNSVEPKIDTTISSRASQESVNAIPTNPLLDNDSRLDNLDATISSRLASNDSRLDNLDATISSRSSHTPADVWSYSNRELTNPDNYKADVSDLAKETTVQSIKSQTDKLKFNTDNDVIATLDGEQVNLTSETEQQIDNIESYVSNPEQYKADVSSLAKESTVQAIKTQTDKLQFTTDNDVKATLDGEAVVLTNDTESQIDNIESTVNQVKAKTDNLPTDPASNTNINNAKDSVIAEIHANKDLIDLLLKTETGNWEIKNNQWIYYDKDGNELFRFNLYDKNGKLSETNVYKRVRA